MGTVAVGIAGIVLFIDYVTGPFIGLGPLYVVPVLLAASYEQKRLTVWLVSVLPLAKIGLDRLIGVPRGWGAEAISGSFWCLGFAMAAVIVLHFARVRVTLERELAVRRHPVVRCVSCHRVEDDQGDWWLPDDRFLYMAAAHLRNGQCADCFRKARA